MTGRGNHKEIPQDVGHRQVFAIDPGVGDHGGKVALRVGATFRHDRRKMTERVHQGRQGASFLLKIRIFAGQGLLGHTQHHRFVCGWHTKHLHDDAQRKRHGDLGEVSFTPGLGQAVHKVAGQRLDPADDFGQPFGREVGLGNLAIGAVVVAIHAGNIAHHLAGLCATRQCPGCRLLFQR